MSIIDFNTGEAVVDAIRTFFMMNSAKKISQLWTWVSGIALCAIIFSVPYQATIHSRSGRDYASYHYAVQAVEQGKSPYRTENLDRLAQAEGTRKQVHPFF